MSSPGSAVSARLRRMFRAESTVDAYDREKNDECEDG